LSFPEKERRLRELPLIEEWKPNLAERNKEKRKRQAYDARELNGDFLLSWFQKEGGHFPPELE
jgi:hypothetical protein